MYLEPADLWLGAYMPILFVEVMFNVLQAANGIDLAQLIEAEQASIRVEFIYRLTGLGYRRGGKCPVLFVEKGSYFYYLTFYRFRNMHVVINFVLQMRQSALAVPRQITSRGP